METALNFLRKSAILMLLGILPFITKAQKETDTNKYRTLFGDNISYGGYGSLSMGYTKIGKYDAFTPGISGAWIIGHGFGLGFEGRGFITELSTGIIPDEDYSFITGGYGGLLIEPVLFGMQPVHVAIPILIGAGAIVFESSNNQYYNYPYSYYHYDYDQFFVFQPGVEVELNLTRFFRLAVGVKYRLTSDVNLTTTYNQQTIEILNKNDLNNMVFEMTFKFGRF